MNSPIIESLKAVASPLKSAAQAAAQEASLRRTDEIARVLRRSGDVKAQATDKASAKEVRGLTREASELSRTASLLQAADDGLDAIGASLKRIVVLIDQASEKTVSRGDLEKFQKELETLRQDVLRLAQQSGAGQLKPLEGSLGTVKVQTSGGATVAVPVLANVITDQAVSNTSIGATGGTSRDYPPPTVPGVVANNVNITASTTPVAQSVTINGRLFELGTFVPDAKLLADAINNIQGEVGVLEARADPNVLIGVSTPYRGRGGRGHGRGGVGGHPLGDWHAVHGPRGPKDPKGHGPGGGNKAPSGVFTINGAVINVSAGYKSSDAERRAAAITAINAVSAETGVVATDNGRGVTLTAADGRNITVLFEATSRKTSASTFGVATTGPAGKTSTIDIRYTRPCGCPTGTVEFSASTGLDPQFLKLTVTAPTSGGGSHPNPAPGLPKIDLADTDALKGARKIVDGTLQMVVAAKSYLANLNEHFSSEVSKSARVMVGASSLDGLRFESASRAGEAVLRLKALFVRDWGAGYTAQANSNPLDALRALGK